ncbi:MAG: 16S rRNA processing protein RimM [Candidatus Eiseniibacteriota bacterium]|nr:MAG: 16S rRNA processing protein RimM [Candidatus Eisenbacteria bacterium]
MSFVVVGEVLKARGVKGELLVRPMTSSMERFLSLRSVWLESDARRSYAIEYSRASGELALVKLKGIDEREQAMKLNGQTMTIPRSEVPPHPEGGHYMFELIGMNVVRTDGIEVGKVVDLLETGSNLVYVVRSADEKETLIPATREVVEELNFEKSVIRVRPIPGLFD